MKKHVLITGTSTGIGHSTAIHLAKAGFVVFAGVRKESDFEKFKGCDNIIPVRLDVASDADIKSAVAFIRKHTSGLYALINNAGVSVVGAQVELEKAAIEQQLMVNVIGVQQITAACFPLLLQGGGRVICISSVAARIAMPFMGAYAMSKAALEAFADSLRREVEDKGIFVSVVQPGAVRTPIWEKNTPTDTQTDQSMFKERAKKVQDFALKLPSKGLDPIELSRAMEKILNARKPKAYYLVTEANPAVRILYLLPKRMIDFILKTFL